VEEEGILVWSKVLDCFKFDLNLLVEEFDWVFPYREF